ncbi:MAG: peroxiredoxin [Candidatus Eremiobacteraeota bacterium]|nr:peroxiredoxin [Candidatus Eremiobacteraeota bacterium]
MLEPGAALPAATLADDSGAQISTRDLVGSPLVLYFYPQDDTPGCTNEATQFRDLSHAFAEKAARIVGVSRDSSASHRRFKEKYGLEFPLLADVDSTLREAFGISGRATFLFDATGTLRHVWPQVRVDGHAGDVLSKL